MESINKLFTELVSKEIEKTKLDFLEDYKHSCKYNCGDFKDLKNTLRNINEYAYLNLENYSDQLIHLKISDFISICQSKKLEEVSFNCNNSLSNLKQITNPFFLEIYDHFYITKNFILNISYEYNIEKWSNSFGISEFNDFIYKFFFTSQNFNIQGEDYLTSLNLDITINLTSFTDNSFLEIIQIINDSIFENLQYLEQIKKPKLEFLYKINNLLKTGIKQYIVYFNDYVKNTKGLNSNLEVENHEDGLLIKIENSNYTHNILDYFNEFMDYLKIEKIDLLKLNYEIHKTNLEIKAETIELKNEISNLKTKYESATLLLEHSKCYNEWITEISNSLIQNPKVHNINVSPQFMIDNHNYNKIHNSNTLTLDIEQLQSNIQKVLQLLLSLKNCDLENEIQDLKNIDDKILEANNLEDLKNNKKFLNIFKRIITNINDENSLLNSTIKATDNGKNILEKLISLAPLIISNIDKLKDLI